jgi:acyl-CoA oxidase
VLAPPDFILNSVLGHSSGNVYEEMRKEFYAAPEATTRASFWQDVVKQISKL